MLITQLKPNQIIIVGTNEKGEHYGGAAAQAHAYFGLEWGISEGLSGPTYAFPTLDKNMKQRTLEEIAKSRDLLYECSRSNPDKEFLLTAVGTGIAGFSPEVIGELFKNLPSNIKRV